MNLICFHTHKFCCSVLDSERREEGIDFTMSLFFKFFFCKRFFYITPTLCLESFSPK